MSILSLRRLARLLDLLLTLDVIAVGISCNQWGRTASNLGQYTIALGFVLFATRYVIQRKITRKIEEE